MTSFNIKVIDITDGFESRKVQGIAQNLIDTLDGKIIDQSDMTLMTIMLFSLVENTSVETVSIEKNDKYIDKNGKLIKSDYRIVIYYKSAGGCTDKSVILFRKSRYDNESMIDDIQHELRNGGLAEIIGVPTINKK